jgi:hypothetical protein
MSGASSEPLPIHFDEIAAQELADAVAWYDERDRLLGDAFMDEFKKAVARIRDFPQAWQQLSPRSRRCRLARFPYGVVYQFLPDHIRIIAVAHLHREPKYWTSREH